MTYDHFIRSARSAGFSDDQTDWLADQLLVEEPPLRDQIFSFLAQFGILLSLAFAVWAVTGYFNTPHL